MPPSFLHFSLTLTTHHSPLTSAALLPSLHRPTSHRRRRLSRLSHHRASLSYPLHHPATGVHQSTSSSTSSTPFSHRRPSPTAGGVPLGSPTIEHLLHLSQVPPAPADSSSTVHLVDALLPPAPFSHRRRRSSLTIGSAVSSSVENLPQPFMSNSRNQNGRSLPPFGNFISYIHSRKHEVYAPATSLRERESWNLYDKKFVHTEYISKSSMTSDNSNKRICVRTEVNPQPSEVPSLEELFRAPRVLAESNGDWVISMMNHYDFPSDIKSMLAAKLLDNPSMFPLMVGFDEKTLLSFIRAVSHKGLFDTWYMEWTARN